jgi:hypothetical protein
MIAIVDRHPERGIVIGAAAAAGESGGLVHHNALALPGEPHRRRQAGEARANDVNGAIHQRMTRV